MSNNSIIISGNNPGAAAENNWMTLLGANVSSNSSASGSTIGWSGSNITLAGTNNSQIIISAPATSSIVGAGGISIASGGSTISVSAPAGIGGPTLSWFDNAAKGFTSVNTYGQGSLSVQHIYVPCNVTATAMKIGGSMSVATNTSVTSASVNFSFNVGVYTLNGSTLSLASSGSAMNAVSWSSNTTGSVTGMRQITAPINVNMTPGDYWVAAVLSTATTYTGHSLSLYGNTLIGNAASGAMLAPFGSSVPGNLLMIDRFAGIYTAATSACPANISSGNLNISSASNVQRAYIYFALYSNTY